MVIIITSIMGLLLVGAVAYLIVVNSQKNKLQAYLQSANDMLEKITTEKESLTHDIITYRQDNARLQTETVRLQERLNGAMHEIELIKRNNDEERKNKDELREITENNFKLLAHEIVATQTAAIREQNELHLSKILNPLKENIDKFRKDVNECYSNESRERFSLQERIKELIEANAAIGREARELSTALRGNSKMQGDWGEMVLETILENSGLIKGEEFEVQLTTDESGNTLRDEHGHGLRPDVTVKYPGPDGGVIVIDSKVSLTAFVDYVNAESDESRERFGKQHLASVIKHINELADKKYQDYIGKSRLDFVMMFIPNESAYAAAVTLDPSLWQKAYDKRVLLVSPTQLVGSLRLIKQLWNQDRQARNAIEIAEKSGAMYDKFVGFVTDMEKIDKALDSARNAYSDAMNKLRDGKGNLITRAEKLRELGVKSNKRLSSKSISNNEE
ncbi:MAG: DNA recombination protein RmuC [Paramuribaculum sp.]|nr:DNA recombination protein RmuC [Paramuribaculum sp.]